MVRDINKEPQAIKINLIFLMSESCVFIANTIFFISNINNETFNATKNPPPPKHAIKQAELYGHTLQREVAFLTVHSMLHLLGYDHINGGLEQMKMREKEELVLAKLGVVRGEDEEAFEE